MLWRVGLVVLGIAGLGVAKIVDFAVAFSAESYPVNFADSALFAMLAKLNWVALVAEFAVKSAEYFADFSVCL